MLLQCLAQDASQILFFQVEHHFTECSTDFTASSYFWGDLKLCGMHPVLVGNIYVRHVYAPTIDSWRLPQCIGLNVSTTSNNQTSWA